MVDRFFETLDLVCQRPALYLGTTSLSVLYGWILGWEFAAGPGAIFDHGEFSEFVKTQLDYFEATLGWHRLILESCEFDEGAAFQKFVEFYKEFKAQAEES